MIRNRVLACHVLNSDNVHATNRAELLLHARRGGSNLSDLEKILP